jgi:hypothetical protein
MANPQIQQLRAQFNNMNTAQKKEFIEKFRDKVAGSTNAEYQKFLSECVESYNRDFADVLSDRQPTRGNPTSQEQYGISRPSQIHPKVVYYGQNKMARILRGFAVVELIAAIIVGIVSSIYEDRWLDSRGNWRTSTEFDVGNLFSWIIIGVVVCILLYAFAEIIEILHDIRKNTEDKL